jgi:hypothetical protein
VAEFTAIGPGVISETEIMSINSEEVSHPLVSISFCISGIMAYPPPKLNNPILKKERNNSRYIIIF